MILAEGIERRARSGIGAVAGKIHDETTVSTAGPSGSHERRLE
jgi:hypothetical protein